jgi:hypothetical protein
VSLSTYLVVYHQIYLTIVPRTSVVVIKCLCSPLRCLLVFSPPLPSFSNSITWLNKKNVAKGKRPAATSSRAGKKVAVKEKRKKEKRVASESSSKLSEEKQKNFGLESYYDFFVKTYSGDGDGDDRVSRPPKVYVSLLTISSSFPTASVKPTVER